MPSVTAYLKDLEILYPLIYHGDINTIDFTITFTVCEVGNKINDAYDLMNILSKTVSGGYGKMRISVERIKEEDNVCEQKIPKTGHSLSNLQ